jgi:hypothetical protein
MKGRFRMNAVERLLGHGEQVLSLYDEMYRERLGSGRDPDLPLVPPTLLFSVGGRAIDAMPKPTKKRRHWLSSHWLQAACETAWLEAMHAKVKGLRVEWLPLAGKGSAVGEAVAARAANIFYEHLAKREQLLCSEVRQRLLADVVVDVREWGPLAGKVVQLAEDVVEQMRRVSRLSDQIEPLDWQRRGRVRLRRALDLLRSYAVPPALVTARVKPGRDRGRSGRPQNDEDLARDLLAGWKAFEPEEGRKMKDHYLAQRLDVRALKTDEARQRKIASLRVALDSALHLQREKTKQKRRARG